MSDLFEISIDYGKSIAQSQKLARIAERCRDIKRDVHKEAVFTEDNWQGKAGYALAQKLVLLQDNLTLTADSLQTVSYNMKRVADDIKQADLKSMEMMNLLGK